MRDKFVRSLFSFLIIAALGPASFVTDANAQSQGVDPLANPLQALSLDDLRATRERPLFTPSRRPPPPPPPPPEIAAEAAPPPPPELSLLGIVVDGNRARAIVRSGSANIARVQPGDDIGGWKVSEIEGHRLVLSLDGRVASFTLFSREATAQPSKDTASQSGDELGNRSQQSRVPRPSLQTTATQQEPTRRRRR